MCKLDAVLLRHVPSPNGPQADFLHIEENGNEHQLRCLCYPGMKMIVGQHIAPGHLQHLEDKYGQQVISGLGRMVTLA